MSLNELDFESSDFFYDKKGKHAWGSEPRLNDVSSLTNFDKITIAKVLKTPLPIEPKLDLDFLNVPSSVPITKVKSNNNVREIVKKFEFILLKGSTKSHKETSRSFFNIHKISMVQRKEVGYLTYLGFVMFIIESLLPSIFSIQTKSQSMPLSKW